MSKFNCWAIERNLSSEILPTKPNKNKLIPSAKKDTIKYSKATPPLFEKKEIIIHS